MRDARSRHGTVEMALVRGPLSEAEHPWRAAVLVGVAGLLIYASTVDAGSPIQAEGPALVGQVLGLALLTAAAAMVLAPRATRVLAPFVIIAGILAFPISLGGLLAGSALTVAGGSLAFSWIPAPPAARLRVEPAVAAARLGATLLDGLIFGVAVILLAATVLNGPMTDRSAVRYGVELAVWLAIVLPGCAAGASPGKLLTRQRVRSLGSLERPGLRRGIVRESVRAAEGAAVASSLVAAQSAQGWRIAFGAGVVLALVCSATGRRRWAPHDLLAETWVMSGRVLVPEAALGVVNIDQRAGAGSEERNEVDGSRTHAHGEPR